MWAISDLLKGTLSVFWANIPSLTGQTRLEHPSQFGPDHLHNHHTLVPYQYRIYSSIQRHRLPGRLCNPRNLHHFFHRAHSPPPTQGTDSRTTMDSGPVRNLHQYWCCALPAGSLGICLLSALNTSYSADHELECTHVRLYDAICCCLLHFSRKECLYSACRAGQAELVKFLNWLSM